MIGQTAQILSEVAWVFRGPFDVTASYDLADVVTHAGGTWYRIDANNGLPGDTPMEGTYWTALAVPGEPGPAGDPGAAGADGQTGPAGPAGADATPITNVTDDGNGNLTIVTSSASFGPFALKGPAGADGADGADATPITNVTDDGNGNLTIVTSSASYGPFALKGPAGDPGADGADGQTGPAGPAGADAPNSNGVTGLSLTVSDPPTAAEVQDIADKLDELINALKTS
jgi:hypothetical protein